MRRITIRSDGRLAIGVLPLAAALLLLSGCDGPQEPSRYTLSGKVTYRGAPVPRGCVAFIPDRAKGNEGVTIVASIVNGVYETPPAKGTTGGPHVVIVEGYDAPAAGDSKAGGRGGADGQFGKPVFAPIHVPVDLPRQDATHDFILPN